MIEQRHGERTGYLAHEGFIEPLLEELGGATEVHGRLVLEDGPPTPARWALNVWKAPVLIPIRSIGHAAAALRAIQGGWAAYAPMHVRRTALIVGRLPHVSAKPLRFPKPPPATPLGSFTLLAPDLLLAAADCSSPFPNGEARFVEDHLGPPSRAYLKLWEALTRVGDHPTSGQRCIDLGGSPGGWTWALAALGARVLAVDKAPLDPRIAALPGVTFRRGSAFELDPSGEEPVDWLCSDVVCYPARLLKLLERWVAARTCRRILATVKFQGPTDHGVVRDFAALPGATLFHGFHNGHELMLHCRLD
ncbi:MAG TPA: SAM-dependent methyltransferase [Polyangia bacterium]|nr:SAM-dependent methyltransferase [Polyangia bacterium]